MTTAEKNGKKKDPVLVVVQLSGGNDFMNTVIPFTEGIYYDNRPLVGVPDDESLPFTDTLTHLLGLTGFEVLEVTPRGGGKYISMSFFVERVGKVHPLLSVLSYPLLLLRGFAPYVNLLDEMVVVARKTRQA